MHTNHVFSRRHLPHGEDCFSTALQLGKITGMTKTTERGQVELLQGLQPVQDSGRPGGTFRGQPIDAQVERDAVAQLALHRSQTVVPMCGVWLDVVAYQSGSVQPLRWVQVGKDEPEHVGDGHW